jgi:hypothetical protein
MSWLFGKTGYSFFEYWTLGHFACWFWIGTITAGLKFDRIATFVASFVLAFAWEAFEKKGEVWFPQFAVHPESWWNRWVSDPLMCVLGLLIAWYGFDHWRTK